MSVKGHFKPLGHLKSEIVNVKSLWKWVRVNRFHCCYLILLHLHAELWNSSEVWHWSFSFIVLHNWKRGEWSSPSSKSGVCFCIFSLVFSFLKFSVLFCFVFQEPQRERFWILWIWSLIPDWFPKFLSLYSYFLFPYILFFLRETYLPLSSNPSVNLGRRLATTICFFLKILFFGSLNGSVS